MKKSLFLIPLLASFSFSTVARADLVYTQTTSSPFGAMMGAGSGGLTSKIYSKGDSNRTEANIFGRKMITITHGAKEVIQIDPATKTYTVSQGGGAAIAKSFMPASNKMPQMSMTVSTKKLGVQNVRGTQAPHWLISMDMKTATPRGPINMKMGVEVWNSQVPYPSSLKTRQDAVQKMPSSLRAMFGNGVKFKGDLKGMSAAFGTVPLRMKMMMNGQPISTTGISNKNLPATLFAVPKGYRAVSNAQFGQMMQASLRKSMGAMMKRPKR